MSKTSQRKKAIAAGRRQEKAAARTRRRAATNLNDKRLKEEGDKEPGTEPDDYQDKTKPYFEVRGIKFLFMPRIYSGGLGTRFSDFCDQSFNDQAFDFTIPHTPLEWQGYFFSPHTPRPVSELLLLEHVDSLASASPVTAMNAHTIALFAFLHKKADRGLLIPGGPNCIVAVET